ncbi:hypothetical protein [Ralstonia pseudosolanacearum]|uniref:hypothetical protein n=1 Tax=Ralstonia pseudosolanacearum TaxID=1310165 RepID=UPI003CEF47EC
MGEAKRRGNRDQRIADAVAAQTTPESVRVAMGLPETCRFHGYVVHLPDTDEFLVNGGVTAPGVSVFQYGSSPDHAKTWSSYRDAERAAAQIKKHRTMVAYLFDNDNQWLLGFDHPDNVPAASKA